MAAKKGAKTGFAMMDKTRHKQLASSGGVTAHRLGRAHQWTTEQAIAAGKKGVEARKRKAAAKAKAKKEKSNESETASGTVDGSDSESSPANGAD